ncbi:MAG: nucleotidyltransferase domain-containing protein [Candidatus Thorarchaeota archaeon]
MMQHHKESIDKLVESIQQDERFLALIIGGSVAKGMEREDSDIDVILVATNEEFKKRKKSNMFLYYTKDFCDYPGGYIDGKVVDLQFLRTVAERGSEPARDAFRDAWIAYSEIPELEDIFNKIPVFQKKEKLKKIQKFYAQFECANWIIQEAEKRNDDYLLTRGITDLILFGGRLILEHNEILYPFHKLFMQTLEKAPDKPENLIFLINTLLNDRNSKNAQALYNTIKGFRKWEISEFWAIRFMLDTEWAWINGKPYVGDL